MMHLHLQLQMNGMPCARCSTRPAAADYGPNHLGLWHNALPGHQTARSPRAVVPLQVSALFHIASSKDPPTMPPGSSPECQSLLLQVGESRLRPHPPHRLLQRPKHTPCRSAAARVALPRPRCPASVC